METAFRAPAGTPRESAPAGAWTGRAGRAPRVAITYPYPIGNRVAGGSRTTPEVARGLARLGVSVVLLPVSTNALSRRFPRRPPLEDLGEHLDAGLAAEGVRVVRVRQHPVHQLLDALRVRDAVADLLAEGPLDAVIGHLHEAGALPSLLAARGVPFVYLATWQTYSRFQDRHRGIGGALRRHAERRLIIEAHRRAERVFAISDFTRRELIELLGVQRERIELCPLGVDPSFRAIERPARAGVRHILFFGRIVYWKGFLDALEALGHVARGGQRDWVYRLVGFGHKQRALDAAREFGIGEQVEVLDPVDDAGLRAHLAWADLALMPSYFESFGLSIAEAQAAGLPVVAYAAGSVPEVVRDGHTGWLAPARDIRALAECIGAALAAPAEAARRGAAGRERAAAEFDWRRTARILYGGLAGLAAARSSSSLPA